MHCPFCENIKKSKRIITENDLAFAFPTNIPIVPGHVLVSPKRHVQYYEDLTQEEKIAAEELRIKMKYALKKAFLSEGFNYAWNEEKIGGQSVPHLHLHIVPRREGDTGIYNYEPREFLYRPGPRLVATQDEELNDVVNAIRNSVN